MGDVTAYNSVVWSSTVGHSSADRASSRLGLQSDCLSVEEKNVWKATLTMDAPNHFEHWVEVPSMSQVTHTLQMYKSKREIAGAKDVHVHMCNYGLESHEEVGSHLVQLFVECGCLSNAQRAFEKLASRNEYCWTSLILGYAEYGDARFSFDLYQKMKVDGVPSSKFTFLALLKACTKLQCCERGRKVHAEISDQGFEDDLVIRKSLLDMYIRIGLLGEAQEAVIQAPVHDVISWNILITGYIDKNLHEEALKCTKQMEADSVPPNASTFVSILKACKCLRVLDKGLESHFEIAKEGFECNPFVSCSLLAFYVKCGLLLEAQAVFEDLLVRDVVAWTTLIAGFVDHGLYEEALDCLEKMQGENVLPNPFTYACSLKACCSLRALDRAQGIHSKATKMGFDNEAHVGNTLVDMYAKCGLHADALKVFDSLLLQDVVSWNALLSGYAERGLAEEVLHGFWTMQQDGVLPTSATLVCTLKACGMLGALDTGRVIHREVAQEGYEEDSFVGSALVDMYSKCGSMEEAQDTFDNISIKDVVSWTALIAGYADHGLGEEALFFLEQMQLRLVSPDATTFVCILKACISMGMLEEGHRIHSGVLKRGLEVNVFVGNCLVELYANLCTCMEAREVFDNLPVKDVVSWNSLLSGLFEQGFYREVLNCFEQMQADAVSPNAGTIIFFLKSCSNLEAVEQGQAIHLMIIERQLEEDLYIGNNLIEMYAKLGLLLEAHDVFDELRTRDIFSWNTLIVGYVDHGFGEEALKLADKMELEGVSASHVTLICSLKACGLLRNIDTGRELHTIVLSRGLERDLSLGNSLIYMYGKCSSLIEVEYQHEKLLVRDSISWSVFLANFAEHDLNQRVLECFENMQLEGVAPDDSAYVYSLKACASLGYVKRSQELHGEIIKKGLDHNLIVGNVLLDLYIKEGRIIDGDAVFNKLPDRNAISWTALVAGYVEQGHNELALDCLDQMHLEGVSPDIVTYVFCLKACGSMRLFDKGKDIHNEVVKKGFNGDLFVGNTLVDMYAKCGCPAEARSVFDELPNQDAVSWHALCVSYAEAGLGDEALNCFEQMQKEGIPGDVMSWNTVIDVYIEQGESNKALCVYKVMQQQGLAPDNMVYLNILQACGNVAALDLGKAIHAQLYNELCEGLDVLLLTALLDMYSKCGSTHYAQQVFEALPVKDVVAWNALLTGYAHQGEVELTVCLFEKMRADGVKPDRVAFLNLLTVCCHAGLVMEAHKCFEIMTCGYKIIPTIEHFNCMIDLLGRSGQLNEAVLMLDNMPFLPDSVAWSTMLGACQKWGNVEVGKQTFARAASVAEDQSAVFVAMSNISVDS